MSRGTSSLKPPCLKITPGAFSAQIAVFAQNEPSSEFIGNVSRPGLTYQIQSGANE